LYHSIVKEQELPGQLEGQQTIADSTRLPLEVKRESGEDSPKVFT
jgi:hypothetical protein